MHISVKKAIAERLLVEMHKRVNQRIGYDPNPDVVVLRASRGWVLARAFDCGFSPDGYLATSRGIVGSLRSSVYNDFRERALRAAKQWPSVLRSPPIRLEDAATILEDVRKQGFLAIILCETRRWWDSLHCRIEQVADDHAMLLGFDGAGRWEKSQKRVELSRVTQVRFGSRYLGLYENYLLGTCPRRTTCLRDREVGG